MTHRYSTIVLALVATVSLIGCRPTAPIDDQTSSSSSSSTTNGRPLSKEGEFCGGIAAFQCEPGLTCKYEGNYPDAGGTCVEQ